MTPEMSRTIRADQISTQGVKMEIEATAEEMKALAKRFDLQDLSDLRAEVKLRALTGGTIFKVDGKLQAKAVQTCVVSLEPVPCEVSEKFSLSFTLAEEGKDEDDLEVFFDEEDPPEIMEDGTIDVGEVVAEHLALALDPFPRKEGVRFESAIEDDGLEDVKKPNPFAALAGMRKNKG